MPSLYGNLLEGKSRTDLQTSGRGEEEPTRYLNLRRRSPLVAIGGAADARHGNDLGLCRRLGVTIGPRAFLPGLKRTTNRPPPRSRTLLALFRGPLKGVTSRTSASRPSSRSRRGSRSKPTKSRRPKLPLKPPGVPCSRPAGVDQQASAPCYARVYAKGNEELMASWMDQMFTKKAGPSTKPGQERHMRMRCPSPPGREVKSESGSQIQRATRIGPDGRRTAENRWP